MQDEAETIVAGLDRARRRDARRESFLFWSYVVAAVALIAAVTFLWAWYLGIIAFVILLVLFFVLPLDRIVFPQYPRIQREMAERYPKTFFQKELRPILQERFRKLRGAAAQIPETYRRHLPPDLVDPACLVGVAAALEVEKLTPEQIARLMVKVAAGKAKPEKLHERMVGLEGQIFILELVRGGLPPRKQLWEQWSALARVFYQTTYSDQVGILAIDWCAREGELQPPE
jgi:hypothetical protein